MTNIAELLKLKKCTILKKWPRSTDAGNSVVTSAPPLKLDGVFSDLSKVEITTSLVQIKGPSDEPLHFHSSHLVGLVVRGHGYMRTDDWESAYVKQGDVVVIPRGVNHYFTCESGTEMDYISYEISDTPIDYQKHFK